MCGIAGILHFDLDRPVDPVVLKAMCDSLYHRGPDGEGYYVNQNLGLGHRRLAIIDLESGSQPMFSSDRSIVVVFNGEIYNYLELRKELMEMNHHFSTSSDTEVIINAYRQWGVDCHKKFNGMWAFALWDNNKQQLFLSRDRIGEKPLYYSVSGNSIIFGSEIKSLLAYGIPKTPNLELIEIYLTLGYIPAPYSFYKDIHKLRAGHCLLIRGNKVTEDKYWDLPQIDENNMLVQEQSVYERFEELLNNSISLRMRSDVPYGAFLSGGLDSASVVALMSGISSTPVETFTAGFNESSFDERKLASIVADCFGSNHHEFIVEAETFGESLKNISHHYDEPFGDSSAIAIGHLSKFARSKVKMILTGDGGDEVLSGYTIYQGEKFASGYSRLPKALREALPSLMQFASKPFTGGIRYKLNRAVNVLATSSMPFDSRYLRKSSTLDLPTIQGLCRNIKVFPATQFLKEFMNGCPYNDSFYKLMYLNHKLSLPDEMLVKVDRMSMANSIEVRAPFLDHRLVEFMAQVHKDVKMKAFERKIVLRESVGRKLPGQLLKARKKGFDIPLREWFKDSSFDSAISNLTSTMPFLDRRIITELTQVNNRSEGDLGEFIWMLFILKKALN